MIKRQRLFSAFFYCIFIRKLPYICFAEHPFFTMRIFIPFLLFVIGVTACNSKDKLFRLVPSKESDIHFNNTIIESDSVNVLDFENVYNGGGVGIADFNADGLQDIYFTGNMVPNKLYLNKGKLHFEDITETAGVTGSGRWCRGVAVVDINNDGRLDMYVAASVNKNPALRKNLLYINQGNDAANKPRFEEMAEQYGLADTTHSTMPAFFDYDNDGDLDVYIVVNHIIQGDYPNRFRPRMLKGEHPSTGRLYRNDWDSTKKQPFFTDVSKQAGTTIEGYGHAVTISDINRDGWKDIYVTNDYLSQNILYINNHDGTFTDRVTEYFKHTSANAMGNDIIDINNDGLSDVIELDMNPEDNYRKKMMLNANSYQTYQNSDQLGYQYQYVRNTLQLNRGPRVLSNDTIGAPVFSDISFFAGVAETDWSWTPMVTDFDNDGFRDIIITNGFPKDVTDHDFISFRKEAFSVTGKSMLLEQIPEVKIHNYAFRNSGDLRFSNESLHWGLEQPSFSNGAAYADLDNDGDMDFAVNNINDEAFVYENTLHATSEKRPAYLNVALKGTDKNRNAIGAFITVYYQGKMQVYENVPTRGYLSSVPLTAHFGLGQTTVIDSIAVIWPLSDRRTVVKNPAINQTLQVSIDNGEHYSIGKQEFANAALFTEASVAAGINYTDLERDFIDFNIQKLLPHKYSESGPALAVADLDGNGLDDLVAGGSYGKSTRIFLQNSPEHFIQQDLQPGASDYTKMSEDAGILLLDVEGDGDQDILIAGGGYENTAGSFNYQDKLYVNDGKAHFVQDTLALPKNLTSKSAVRAADMDGDGDLDLLLAGRVEPWNYPKPVSSFIYRNESTPGKPHFVDVTATAAPALVSIGLVSDAIWTDLDSDGQIDFILAGEWMPVRFFKNNKGQFTDITASTGTNGLSGWWRSILPADVDNDGDIDYVLGNLGTNSYYRASPEMPVRVYAKDYDHNNSFDAIPSLYLPASMADNTKREYPAQTRDDMVKQIIGFRSKFQNYKLYAQAPMEKMLTPEELKGALKLEANTFAHMILLNQGGLLFKAVPLSAGTQFSCINGMIAEDINADGNLDLIINGNDYGTEVSVGRYDACTGTLLMGDGKGGFSEASMLQSGLYIPGNGKALVTLKGADGKQWVAASQNRGRLLLFKPRDTSRLLSLEKDDQYAVLTYANGKKQKREFGYGASYLSQSGRWLKAEKGVRTIELFKLNGQKRSVTLSN